MIYQLNPELPVIRSDWRGNPKVGKEYQYVFNPPFRPEWRAVFRYLTTPNPQREEKRNDDWQPSVATDRTYLEDRSWEGVVWYGHACFLIQLNGIRLLTDPVLRNLPGGLKRRAPAPLAPENITGIDYLLLSHDHRDHTDQPTIRRLLKRNAPAAVLTGLEMRSVIGKWVGETPIQEAGWFQQYHTVPGIEIVYMPAKHWCRRGLFDFNRRLWGSFIIRTEGKCIFFGADSGYGAQFRVIGEEFPDIDLALLGVGAYKPAWMMQPMHTSPDEAVRGFHDLGARKMLPMHYGTYDLSREPWSEPENRLRELFHDHPEQLVVADWNSVIAV